MLVNDLEELTEKEIMKNHSVEADVEFIRYYDYSECNLCYGILQLNINGKKVSFGPQYKKNKIDFLSFFKPIVCYANADIEDETYTSWETDVNILPDEFKAFAKKIDEVINKNMPTFICKGCD